MVTTPGNLAFALRRLPAYVGLMALPFPSNPEPLALPGVPTRHDAATGSLRGEPGLPPRAVARAAVRLLPGALLLPRDLQAAPGREHPGWRPLPRPGDSDTVLVHRGRGPGDSDTVLVRRPRVILPLRPWLVGPLFLATGESPKGGGDKDEDPEGCLAWLDERRFGSVV